MLHMGAVQPNCGNLLTLDTSGERYMVARHAAQVLPGP